MKGSNCCFTAVTLIIIAVKDLALYLRFVDALCIIEPMQNLIHLETLYLVDSELCGYLNDDFNQCLTSTFCASKASKNKLPMSAVTIQFSSNNSDYTSCYVCFTAFEPQLYCALVNGDIIYS